MENELQLGNIYTGEFLQNFLSQDYRQNLFLASTNDLNLMSLPRENKYIVYDIQSAFLHRFSEHSYLQNYSDFKFYYIKPA
jgi:hypothetical protein